MYKSLLVCLTVIAQLLSLSDCDIVGQVENRIYKGQITENLLKYQVLIYKTLSYAADASSKCTGSLITVNYVLTAANCINNGLVATLIFGANFSNRPEKTQVIITSIRLIVHSEYNETTKSNNIGLVQLPEPIKLVDGVIDVIKLPPKSTKSPNYDLRIATISGYGKIDDDLDSINSNLRIVFVQILSESTCRQTWVKPADPNTMCGVGVAYGKPCLDDEGAPLIDLDTNIQIGIASYGAPRCDSTVPFIYTKVVQYLDWIEQNSDYRVVFIDLNKN